MCRLAALVLLVALVATLAPPPASSQVVVYDPANWTQQILQYAQMLVDYYLQFESLVNEIQQLLRLIDQVEMMAKNLEELEALATDNPAGFLAQIAGLFRTLEGIVYQADDLLLRYDEIYTPGVALDLPVEEDERLSQTLRTFRTLLAGAHQTSAHSFEAANTLSRLSRQLDDAEGNLQALQAVGAMTTQVATETTRLAELNAMTLNALTVYYSHQLAEREHAERTFLDWVTRGRFYAAGPRPRTFDVVPGDFRFRQ